MSENRIVDAVPREMRTPITEAGSALSVAWDFWVEMIGDAMDRKPENDCEKLVDPAYFASNFFGAAWDDPDTNGDKAAEEIGLSLDGERDPVNAPYALLQVMIAIVAYAVQAMKAEKDGKHNEAWTYVADAKYWAGILQAAWTDKKLGVKPAVEMAKKRHAENYALVDDALKYWREKIDPNLSASKAANELLQVVPLSHKKLAEVVSAEKKKRT